MAIKNQETASIGDPGDFLSADKACIDFQYLENLSTAYWYSNVLFTAIELNLFELLEKGCSTLSDLAAHGRFEQKELERLLKALERMALVGCYNGGYYNAQVASLFLVPGKSDYMGHFFLYRKYMRTNWDNLTRRIWPGFEDDTDDADYERRNRMYVGAMDTLMRQKAKQIAAVLKPGNIDGPVLDIGGGAGTMLRQLQRDNPQLSGTLLDLPEVIDAAKQLYPEQDDWRGLSTITGDFRGMDTETEIGHSFSSVILSNFLHAYSAEEAKLLLEKACRLLDPDGLMVIHDYFPDRLGAVPQKGAMYDLAMMMNTYNGACHSLSSLVHWAAQAGLSHHVVRDLESDTSVIVLSRNDVSRFEADPWQEIALEIGFDKVLPIDPQKIITAPWVAAKCRFGCEKYSEGLQCPPHSMPHDQTRSLLDSYSTAYLVQGEPPGKDFHNKLLALEKTAFLKNQHKSFVMGAGPCPVCDSCVDEGSCRFPHLARPAMEACGIDVYTTLRQAGLSLETVKEKSGFVKYFGLFLLE